MALVKNVLLAVALLGVLGLIAAACDNEAEPQSNAQQGYVDALEARVQQNEMLNAVLTLGALGMHDMDTNLNETGIIDPSYSRNTTTALRVLALTDWGEHREQAETVRMAAIELLAALHDEDVEAAGAAATELHVSEHDLSGAAWATLLGDLPEEQGGVAGHADEGDSGEGEDHGDDEEPASEEMQ